MRPVATGFIAFVSSFVIVACATSQAPPPKPVEAASVAPQAKESAPLPLPPTSSARTSEPTGPRATEEEIAKFLAPRSEEQSAEPSTLFPKPNPEQEKLAQKCEKTLQSATARAEKLPLAKRFPATMKALQRADKRCLDKITEKDMKSMVEKKDATAQHQMQVLAKALATAPKSCGKGSMNPAMRSGACLRGFEAFVFDREGWSCIAKNLSEEEKAELTTATYVYSFAVDERLGTYQVVGTGCHTVFDAGFSMSSVETELVLRGKLGSDPDPKHFYRRTPASE